MKSCVCHPGYEGTTQNKCSGDGTQFSFRLERKPLLNEKKADMVGMANMFY